MTELSAVYALFDQLSDGICLAAAGGDVIYLNPAAKRLLELSGSPRQLPNLCGILCARLRVDGDGCGAAAGCPLRDPASPIQAVTFAGKHGPRASFNWSDDRVHRADRFRDLRVRCMRTKLPLAGPGDEELHLVLIEDAAAEVELERHHADWSNMIAHDLRAPLTSIYSALRLLEEIHPSLKNVKDAKRDEDSQLVDVGLSSCRRMMELLDLYLDVARFDAKAMPVTLEEIELSGAVDDVAAEQGVLASEGGLLVEIDVPKGLKIRADKELLARVLENLVNNAIKYNVRGGSVKISATKVPGKVVMTVRNTGRGIEAKDLPHIFDRYYQAEARRAGRIKGNGLGLTFCKEALALMGAEIGAASETGKGAEFHVAFAQGGGHERS